MDVLALENFVLEKQNQQELSQQQVDQYLADFALD
jgi:hypothetical protein